MENIRLIKSNLSGFVSKKELDDVAKPIRLIHDSLQKKQCPGCEYAGWLDLPSSFSSRLLRDIEATARRVRQEADVLLVLGIGGSYLGARATIDFLKPFFSEQRSDTKPLIYFAGQNLSADYLNDLLQVIKGKKVMVNVISKSGTTTETAVTFRIVRQYLDRIYGKKKAAEKIIATTDKSQGALRRLADEQGYKSFVIPDDIGGRFSVLTPVGLLPIAAAGINIRALLKGAADFERKGSKPDIKNNPAYAYAALRHVLYTKGKNIEILSAFHPSLHYVCEWWKQLFGESEGKDHKGVWPATANFTTDLHSLGQMIQDGRRNMFETFLTVKKESSLKVPAWKDNIDNLNYLAGKEVGFINSKAYEATAKAHFSGGVPNLTIEMPARTPYHLGQLFYFFERAVAMSGLLNGVNPFNQPGVEAYKKKMFKLLGKPRT